MGSPVELPDLKVYAGDELDISLTFQSIDLTGFNHVAQIRHRQSDANTLTTFELTRTKVGSDTIISLHLDGDSALGTPDSIVRTFGRSVYWDLQQLYTDGSANETLAYQELKIEEDVTR